MDITNKSALVTGGASGLGLATVKALQSAGARVVIVDLPTSKGADVAAEIGATFAPADVTNEEQVAAAVETAAGLGPLAVVVNCAGIANAIRVVAKDGTREQAASWTIRAENGEVASFSGSTAIAMDKISRIDLETPDGDLLLRVPA